MIVTPPTPLARAKAASHDAWIVTSDLAVKLRNCDERERGDMYDGFVQGIGHLLFSIQWEAEKANTRKATPADARRAAGLLGWLADPEREWHTGEGGAGRRGCDFSCKSTTKVQIFLTTDEGDRAWAITERRRHAHRMREDAWRAANPGKRTDRNARAFRFPPSHFDKSNPAHGSFVTFTRGQIMGAVAAKAEPEQLELAL